MSSNADYARYLVQAATDAVAVAYEPGEEGWIADDARAATAAVLRQLANHPRLTPGFLEEIADEIEGDPREDR